MNSLEAQPVEGVGWHRAPDVLGAGHAQDPVSEEISCVNNVTSLSSSMCWGVTKVQGPLLVLASINQLSPV